HDGKVLASWGPEDNTLRLWEVATGQLWHRLEGHHGPVNGFSFSADSRRLATSSEDTSILVWNLTGLIKDHTRALSRYSPKEGEAFWTDLAGQDAAQAYQALAALTATPSETVAFLQERLRPAPEITEEHLARLITDLDADEFATREKAAEELER